MATTEISPTIWKVRKGAEKRIRAKHPWVFSNELDKSPKGHTPGNPVLLMDSEDRFLAAGYGNPNSLISFRALSFNPSEKDFFSIRSLVGKVIEAWKVRKSLGFHQSFRLCYGEGDFLPGIVIDRYVGAPSGNDKQSAPKNRVQVLVFQILTFGVHNLLGDTHEFAKQLCEAAFEQKLSEFSYDQTAIVIRNDVNIRKLEGLTVENPRVLKELSNMNLTNFSIEIESDFSMSCDLIEGQKTGFFLDQVYNIQLMSNLLKRMDLAGRTIKVLDLCCYVGHWSSRISWELGKRGIKVEAWCIDVSETALEFAKSNVERNSGTVKIVKTDVLADLSMIPEGQFDIVIADPPAFIKAKKDVPTGTHAYLKLNTAAFKFVKNEGLVASCSCSGLFEEEMLKSVVEKSIRRNGKSARCISHGGHSADHPVLLGFSEGFYLKMFINHVVN
jgi:23S rRNA (cytosine1962-C5)-methyltransferase